MLCIVFCLSFESIFEARARLFANESA